MAFVPLAAFIAEQLYFTIAQLMSRVPALLFYGVDAVLLFGAMFGAIGTVRVVRKNQIDGRAWFWLVAAVALSLVCFVMFARLTFPWL